MKSEGHDFTASMVLLPTYYRLIRPGVPRGMISLLLMTISMGCGNRSQSPENPESGTHEQTLTEAPLKPSLSEPEVRPSVNPGLERDDVVPRFRDVAVDKGIHFHFYSDAQSDRYLLPEVMGGGAGWIDIDLDNRPDLYLVNGSILQPRNHLPPTMRNALYRQGPHGLFSLVPAENHCDTPHYGQGCAVGDYNADGFPDIFLSNYGNDTLLMNNGDGTFGDVSDEAGTSDPGWSTSCLWLDLDADQDLDLIVVNYLDVTMENNEVCFYGDSKGYCGPGRYHGVADRVYLNESDGTFRESAMTLGFNPFHGKGLAILASDFNLDLQPEIYIANDMTANFLYTRRQTTSADVHYDEIAAEAGCAVSGEGMNEASMGISCADFDQNGLNDIYLTHYYQMKNTLYRNLGDLLFEDDSWRTGVASQTFSFLGFGTFPLDYNADGAPDLFVTNGHVLGAAIQPHAMTPQLLRNDGQGNFTDVSSGAGDYFRTAWLGRGVAASDFDNDGDIDLAITHLEQASALLENSTVTQKSFVGISLQSEKRSSTVCARVIVKTAAHESMQIQNAGGSYLSSSDARMIFPVNEDSVSIEILWPSGHRDSHTKIQTGRYWKISEGRSPMSIPQ